MGCDAYGTSGRMYAGVNQEIWLRRLLMAPIWLCGVIYSIQKPSHFEVEAKAVETTSRKHTPHILGH